MKKVIIAFISIFLLTISCDNDSTGTAPTVTNVFVHSSISGLSGPTEITSFSTGQTAYFRVTVIDPDVDATSLIITYKSDSMSLGPESLPFTQLDVEQTMIGYIRIMYSGTWQISAYCVDAKGNKGNTVVKMITVS